MAEPIHSWNYIEDRQYSSTIELFHDHILVHSAKGSKQARKYSFEDFLLQTAVLGNLIVDLELLEYVTTLSVAEEFSPEAQKVYHFYKNFDPKNIVAASYEHDSNAQSSVRYFRTITAHGLEQYYENEEGIYIQSRQRFDQFFFRGPLMTDLPLDLRKRWRTMVWAGLKEPRAYQLDEGFPLFDYYKIVPKKYKYRNPDVDAGDFLEIHDGYILIGGWDDRQGGGGARKYSMEQIWYNERLIPESLSDYLHEIHDNLAGAIIEGNRKRRYRRIAPPKEPQDYSQSPGEAPPA
jgi:hypothetical protein